MAAGRGACGGGGGDAPLVAPQSPLFCLPNGATSDAGLSWVMMVLMEVIIFPCGFNMEETSPIIQLFLCAKGYCSSRDILVLLCCHPIVCHGWFLVLTFPYGGLSTSPLPLQF
jgi:hypothetical protein